MASIVHIIYSILALGEIIPPTGYIFQICSYIFIFTFQILTCVGYFFLGLIIRNRYKGRKDEIKLSYGFSPTYIFFILAFFVIVNEAYFTWVELVCSGEGCLGMLPILVTTPSIGVISFIAFLTSSDLFPENENSEKIPLKCSSLAFKIVAVLEAIRYISGLLSINESLKFSCTLCDYRSRTIGSNDAVLSLNTLSTSSDYYLYVLNYVITPILYIIIGIVLLYNYLEYKRKTD
ncbi:MAG: hypothetical protein KGD64_05960 [Candidatus Heimdallarchaeota archaeon]|nr:hypothetical protein [Candidatus Heimdallarchaeota archaeon]